jgi:hypothetical protein
LGGLLSRMPSRFNVHYRSANLVHHLFSSHVSGSARLQRHRKLLIISSLQWAHYNLSTKLIPTPSAAPQSRAHLKWGGCGRCEIGICPFRPSSARTHVYTARLSVVSRTLISTVAARIGIPTEARGDRCSTLNIHSLFVCVVR